MIRVIIVEDMERIREGLAVLLNGTDGLTCVAEYGSCEDMLAQVANDRPDLILMDIGLPGMSGIEGIQRLRKTNPNVAVIMLTVYEDDDHIFRALCAGACGYLLKNTPPAKLVAAIEDAHAGGSPMTSRIARRVVTLFQRNFAGGDDVTLSEREHQVLTGLANGLTYKAIAAEHAIAVDTVRYHIRKIYDKLHVQSQTEAVSRAIRKGLI